MESEISLLLTLGDRVALEQGMEDLSFYHGRVELKKVSSSKNAYSVLRDLTQSYISIGEQECEEGVFRWQQKVFSQHEEELYADANNCVNTVEELYHRDILELRSQGGRSNKRLFSYVEKDCFKNPVTLVSPALTEPECADLTFAAAHVSTVRRRYRAHAYSGTSLRNPVSTTPSDDERLAHRIAMPPTRSMYIMADLRQMDGLEADEHVLCFISANDRGEITLDPDFNPGPDKSTYRVEGRHEGLFEYRLEHASKPASPDDLIREKAIISELYRQRVSSLDLCVGSSFTEPPDGDSLRVMLLGEIVSAHGFEYNNLYVTAHLELPECWELESKDHSISPRSQLPSITTQICSTRSTHKLNIAHFGCPMEFLLCLQHNSPKYTLPMCPRILMEVASIDYWDRHRVEGYGNIEIPQQPGLYELIVETWRPIGRPIVDQMKRYFTGGPPEIDDITYIATPKDFHGTHLSRYGFRSESSGTIQLRLHIAHQSSAFIEKPQVVQPSTRYKGFKGAVAAVLQSYQRAKDRAISMKTTLQVPRPKFHDPRTFE